MTVSIHMNARALLILFASVLLPACALFPKSESAGSEAGRLVALDFVNVLQQVEGLKPTSTVLDFRPVSSASNSFADSLEMTLQKAGYAIRAGGSGTAQYPVSYSIVRKVDSATGQMVTYTLSVGQVSMRRSYRPTEDGRVAPVAAMQVKGIDASSLHLNDSIFKPEQRPDPGKGELMVKGARTDSARTQSAQVKTPLVVAFSEPGVQAAAEPPKLEAPVVVASAAGRPQAKVVTPPPVQARSVTEVMEMPSRARASQNSLIDIAAPSIAKSSKASGVFGGLAALSQKPTRNMRDIGESNFEAALNDFSLVRETILTFGDDSLRLGNLNKSRVQQFVELFAEDSDVFSIIGCSHGPTRRDFGQQGLALGRAQRVRDELMFSGVPEERILDEGCWAEDSFDERFPRRGVVLSLLRPTA